jgi:YD repeat-containing protein
MLRTAALHQILAAARVRELQRVASRVNVPPAATAPLVTVTPPAMRVVAPDRRRGIGTPAASTTRNTQTVPTTPGGTGINPWWRYQEKSIPGGGHVMVNVGTGNVILQGDDMSVPHKGLALAFRRTYNSQAPAAFAGSNLSWVSLYGTGWTNTFDAHIVKTAADNVSVFDTDGARYDYVTNQSGNRGGGYHTTTAGQYGILSWDGSCGFTWTKKSGTTYYFYDTNYTIACPSLGTVGAYAGRLHQIIGRNSNTTLTFAYSWDNGDASMATGKVNAITVQSESGAAASLSFSDVSGRRLLQQLVYPDGVTSVSYGYDANGNLTAVSQPPNNAAGTRPVQYFTYQTLGTDSVLQAVVSPRWCAQSCGADGTYMTFGFSGTNAAASTLNGIWSYGLMNPVVPDGTGTSLQPGYSTAPSWYDLETYTTGVPTPTFRDADGHAANWVVDSLGRPTQNQQCTAMVGGTCTGIWLISNETWDSANNLVSEVEARGNETDYLHDPMGNTTAVGEPYNQTSQGTFKPTRLYDYDGFNNVVGFCDENETHQAAADWTTPSASVSANESLCSSQAGGVPHWHSTYSYPSYEQYGELASATTPLGYTRTFSYAASQQAGVDYGLPTSVAGASFTQLDGSANAPTQTLSYDAAGNLRCFSKGQGTSVLSYDTLGRVVSVGDPDDSSANATSLCGKSTGQAGWNTQTTYTYFANGATQSSQSPAERAGGVATTFTYDLDGDATSETRHYSCSAGFSCTPGVTTKWYDAADHVVEVALPHDPTDYYASAWLTRYLYDLSGGGTVSVGGGGFHAYGNIFKTQEWVAPYSGASTVWRDVRGSAFDALDRAVVKYSFSPSSNTTPRATTMTYDASAGTLGMLASTVDPLGQTTAFTYDSLTHPTAVQFSGDGGVTPQKWFAYDAMGRVTSATGAVYGTETTRYDGDGRVAEVDEPTTGAITSAARMTYDYYPDGTRKDVNVASAALTAAPLLSYAYRADGKRRWVHVGFGQQQGNFVTTFTDAGRAVSRSDPFTGSAMPNTRSPVASGTLYGPTTWAYDTAGQVSRTQLPQTFAYQAIGHDDESVVTNWTASDSSNGPVTANFGNTIRGENIVQSLGSGATVSYSAHIANGAAVRAQPLRSGPSAPPVTGVATSVDPVNAIIASTSKDVYVPGSDPDGPQWVNCGNQTMTNGYDAASRFVSKTQTVANVPQTSDCGGIDSSPNILAAHTYDAENHHIDPATSGGAPDIQWSPSGHAYKLLSAAANVHYDGGGILFVTDQNGALSQVKVGTMADIDGSGHLTVIDRDFADHYSSRHDNTFYGGVWLGSTIYRNSYTPPTTIPYVFWGSTNDTSCQTNIGGTSCTGAGQLEYDRPEGFLYAGLTFQGERAVDTASGQWTTPDAYAGTVHDPMSQKSFMSDRNNPYSYSDPSGFAPQRAETASPDGSYEGITSAGPAEVADAGVGPGQLALDVVTAVDNALKQLRDKGEHAQDITELIVDALMDKNSAMKDHYNSDDPQRLQRYSFTEVKTSQGFSLTVTDSRGTAHATLSIRDNSVVLRVYGMQNEIVGYRKDVWFDQRLGWPMFRAPWSRGVALPMGIDNSPGGHG